MDIINENDLLNLSEEEKEMIEEVHELLSILRAFPKSEVDLELKDVIEGLDHYENKVLVFAMAQYMMERKKFYKKFIDETSGYIKHKGGRSNEKGTREF